MEKMMRNVREDYTQRELGAQVPIQMGLLFTGCKVAQAVPFSVRGMNNCSCSSCSRDFATVTFRIKVRFRDTTKAEYKMNIRHGQLPMYVCQCLLYNMIRWEMRQPPAILSHPIISNFVTVLLPKERVRPSVQEYTYQKW